jgi:hypothetical protein
MTDCFQPGQAKVMPGPTPLIGTMEELGEQCNVVFALNVTEPESERVCIAELVFIVKPKQK